MKVKTADLKNNLSKYLRRIRETGETITVCDRDRPVAILSPAPAQGLEQDRQWLRKREQTLEKAAKWGIPLRLPAQQPRTMKEIFGSPPLAPDGRRDIRTIALVRRREY